MRHHHRVRTPIVCLLAAGLLVGLTLVPGVVRAQTVHSDDLSEGFDLRVNNPKTFPIPENGEGLIALPFPSRDIDFFEPDGFTRSDRLHIDAFNVTITNDTNPGGMDPRATAARIPASAFELFLPLSINATSRGDIPGTDLPSDEVVVEQGVFFLSGGKIGRNPGVVIDSDKVNPPPFTEPPDEKTSELYRFVIPEVKFDVEEPLSETGGVAGRISEYVDLPEIHGFFLSSQNPTDYVGFLPPNGQIQDGIADYFLRFQSDPAPEPRSLVLLSAGLLPMGLFAFGRYVQKRRRNGTP